MAAELLLWSNNELFHPKTLKCYFFYLPGNDIVDLNKWESLLPTPAWEGLSQYCLFQELHPNPPAYKGTEESTCLADWIQPPKGPDILPNNLIITFNTVLVTLWCYDPYLDLLPTTSMPIYNFC